MFSKFQVCLIYCMRHSILLLTFQCDQTSTLRPSPDGQKSNEKNRESSITRTTSIWAWVRRSAVSNVGVGPSVPCSTATPETWRNVRSHSSWNWNPKPNSTALQKLKFEIPNKSVRSHVCWNWNHKPNLRSHRYWKWTTKPYFASTFLKIETPSLIYAPSKSATCRPLAC